MELTGKLIQVLQLQTGQGKNGPWQKQEFVVETLDQFPRKVCFSVWGDKVNDLQRISQGNMLRVQFNLESREFNGRWYTDARAYRVEVTGTGNGSAPFTPAPPPPEPPADLTPQPDDLPF